MTNQASQLQQMKPYIIVAGVLLILVVAVLLWPTKPKTTPSVNQPVQVAIPDEVEVPETKIPQPDSSPTEKQPTSLELGNDNPVQEFEAQEIVEDIPVDTSDAAIKSALVSMAKSPLVAKLLVNEGLLDKIVINVHSIASGETSTKDSLLQSPPEPFATYQQANKRWIDPKSYKRYNNYATAFSSVDADELLSIYETYAPQLREKYAEISRPGEDFDDSLIRTIDVLLATPNPTYPLEVYSDSVMYKFADARLENLSAPQKHLLRMGPENMRKVKAQLERIKATLEAN